jgi:MFS family permease
MSKQKAVNSTLVTIAVLILGLQDVGAGAASPALANIMQAFPTYAPTTIMSIVSIPPLMPIVAAIIMPKLVQIFQKRTLCLMGLALFIAGGVGPAFLNNIPGILFCRALLGLAVGTTLPISLTLVADLFEGEKRNKYLGYHNMLASLGAVFFQYVGGYLCTLNWHYTFFAYLMPLWILIFVYFFLPEPEKISPAIAANQPEEKGQFKFTWAVFLVLFNMFIVQFVEFTQVTNASVMIVNEKIGDASTAGMTLTLFTGGAVVSSFIFGNVNKLLKRFTFTLVYVCFAIGFYVFATAHTAGQCYLGTFLAGLGIGFYMPSIYARVPEVAPAGVLPFVNTLLLGAMGLGQFLQPYGFTVLQNIFHLEIGRQLVGAASAIFIGFIVISVIYNIFTRLASISGKHSA